MQILPEALIFAEIAFYFSLKNLHICRIAKIQSYEKRWSLFVLKRACAKKFFLSIFEDAKKDFFIIFNCKENFYAVFTKYIFFLKPKTN